MNMASNECNDWKGQNMAENRQNVVTWLEVIEMAENCLKQLEIAGNGWNWQEMTIMA